MNDLARFQRQTNLPQIGRKGQQKLQNARILCIGAGGLGSPALLYLAAAGVGRLGIVDADRIELSNLQRQVLFTEADIGKLKVDAAARHLRALNSECQIDTYPVRLSLKNSEELINQYDVIIDGSDNFATRYLVNDTCVVLNKPLVQASVQQFQGQCLVVVPNSPCYRCLFPQPPQQAPDCNSAGVLGMLPGIFGNIQALEAVKYSVGLESALTQQLLTLDGLNWQWQQLQRHIDPECAACQQHQSLQQLHGETMNSELDPSDLDTYLQQHSDAIVLDVRTAEEFADGHLETCLHIPLNELQQRLSELPQDKELIVACAHGLRSQFAVQCLLDAGVTRVRNLRGGLAGL